MSEQKDSTQPPNGLTPEAMRAANLAASGLQNVTTETQAPQKQGTPEPTQSLLVNKTKSPLAPQQISTAQKYNVNDSAMLA